MFPVKERLKEVSPRPTNTSRGKREKGSQDDCLDLNEVGHCGVC